MEVLIRLCTAHEPRTEAIFVGHFVRDSLEHIFNRGKIDRRMPELEEILKMDRKIATEHMDSLLDYYKCL